MGDHGLGLMLSSPEGPCQDKSRFETCGHEEASDQGADFGDGGDEGDFAPQAAIDVFGLVSFGLLQAERRKSAPNLARKAAAAMTNVMWRCQPCQERASQ
jgi:hypothetical protein